MVNPVPLKLLSRTPSAVSRISKPNRLPLEINTWLIRILPSGRTVLRVPVLQPDRHGSSINSVSFLVPVGTASGGKTKVPPFAKVVSKLPSGSSLLTAGKALSSAK